MNKKRSLFVALPLLGILAALAFYEYVYLQIKADIAAVRETQTVKANSLQKYLAFVAKKPELETRLVELKETVKADESKLLSGDTLSLAAASLQTTVKGMITSRSGTISSERVEKPEDLGKFKVVSVSIDGVVPDPRALSDVLYAMETQTPYLAVRELDVRVRNFREPRELMIRLKVSGITRGK
jgi:hypothetical protein